MSPDLISTVTNAVLDEVAIWQQRPLDPVYPLVFFDALRVKIRDEGMVRNKPVPSMSRGRSTSRSASVPMVPRRCWACGWSRTRVPNSGSGS